MNEIKAFNNSEFGEIRTMEINGEPWFVGNDIAKALGYKKPTNAVSTHVHNEDTLLKGVHDSNGKTQKTKIVNESGMYALIFGSELEKSQKFKHWVTSEVLPSIRKHGVFATDELLNNLDFLINALQELNQERQEKALLQAKIEENAPKVSYHDFILNNKDLLSTTMIAKDYGMTAAKLNKILHEKGVQFNQSGVWFLYQKYAEEGYVSSKTHTFLGSDGKERVKQHTHWTQKGRLFIYKMLKEDQITPLIENQYLQTKLVN